MLTSLVVAILNDSAFFMKYFDEAYIQIREPMPHSFNFKNDSTSKQILERIENMEFDTINGFDGYTIHKRLDQMLNYRLPNAKNIFRYGEIHAFFFALCSQPANYDKLFRYGLVKQETIDRARVMIKELGVSNVYTNETILESALQVGFEVGGNLLGRFWVLNDNMSLIVDKYVSKYFTDSYVIGVQFRSSFFEVYAENVVQSSDLQHFQECALNIERDLLSRNQTKKVFWFIASDNPTVINVLAAKYPEKVFWMQDETPCWGRIFLDK